MKAYFKLFGFISILGIITLTISCCLVANYTDWIRQLLDLLPKEYTRQQFKASNGTSLKIMSSTFCDAGDIGHVIITDAEGNEIYKGWMDFHSCGDPTPKYKIHEKAGLVMLEDIREKQIELLLDTSTNKLWLYQWEVDGGTEPELLNWAQEKFEAAYPQGAGEMIGPQADTRHNSD